MVKSAADLLALGDYAVAYPSALIHCHGTRQASDDLTSEKAALLADSLERSNDAFALRLARKTFRRIAFHFANLRSEFSHTREQIGAEADDIECFAATLFSRLPYNPEAGRLLKRAREVQQKLEALSSHVFERLPEIEVGTPWRETEAEILKHVLDYELSLRGKDDPWDLSGGGIYELLQDFLQLSDYMGGSHRDDLDAHIEELGSLLLDDAGLREYENKLRSDASAADVWLKEAVEPLVEPLWYFVIALCRLLQRGEYQLSATEAYWLGIVDEVIGEPLPSLRVIAENPGA